VVKALDEGEFRLISFYAKPALRFADLECNFRDSKFVVLGVPFDETSSYRPGSRFAPLTIREASMNIELYSFRLEVDGERVKVFDGGDVTPFGGVEETLSRVEKSVRKLVELNKTPVLIGGEHTITYGAVNGLSEDTLILDFDAHFDLRDEYMGRKLCHATFMRRLIEKVGGERVIVIGVRAASSSEVEYAKEAGLKFLTTMDLRKSNGVEEALKTIVNTSLKFSKVYVTIDADVLDPAFAPGVSNPESDGLDVNTLLSLLTKLPKEKIVGFDLVEVNPLFDNGATSILAAKIIMEMLCLLSK